jgi:predicted lipid-binding transport protein (Tim44 family)
MGGGLLYLDIILFALVAAFLIYRLRSVLGRRTGNERPRPNPYQARRDEAGETDNVVHLPGREGDRAGGLTEIKLDDPSFNEAEFLEGAKIAYGMIIEAYANSDTGTLRPLLSDELYDSFSEAIRERDAAGEQQETNVHAVRQAEITDARVEGRTAYITVRFESEQTSVTRDANGAVIDGDPDKRVDAVDIWTFARNLRASDPNWTLVGTQAPDEDAGEGSEDPEDAVDGR